MEILKKDPQYAEYELDYCWGSAYDPEEDDEFQGTGLLQALDLWKEVSETGEHPLKWGYYFTLLIRDKSPF